MVSYKVSYESKEDAIRYGEGLIGEDIDMV